MSSVLFIYFYYFFLFLAFCARRCGPMGVKNREANKFPCSRICATKRGGWLGVFIRALHSLQLQRPLSADTDTQDTQIHAAICVWTGLKSSELAEKRRGECKRKRGPAAIRVISNWQCVGKSADFCRLLATSGHCWRLWATFRVGSRCKWGSRRVVAN